MKTNFSEIIKSEHARMSALLGGVAIADLMKPTLGPYGADKIINSRTAGFAATNDGATILSAVSLSSPTTHLLVALSKAQDEACGDGTTSVCVLAGELLRQADSLLSSGLSPHSVLDGLTSACRAAEEALRTYNTFSKNSPEHTETKQRIKELAETVFSSKILAPYKELFSAMLVEMFSKTVEKDVDELPLLNIIKVAGDTLNRSFLANGLVLPYSPGLSAPQLPIRNAKVLVTNTPMDADRPKIFGTKAEVESLAALASIEEAEKTKFAAKTKIVEKSGCNVFVNRQLVYDYQMQLLHEAGILVVENANFDGVASLSNFCGAELATAFVEDGPFDWKLGEVESVETETIGKETFVAFKGAKESAGGGAHTIVLRGASSAILEEAERTLNDAIVVVKNFLLASKKGDDLLVAEGGCCEMTAAAFLERAAITGKVVGKRAIVWKAAAKAFYSLAETLAKNAGLDGPELVATAAGTLHEQLAENKKALKVGLDLENCKIVDPTTLGLFGAFAVKRGVFSRAAEAVEAILRIDAIIKCEPRPREEDHTH